MRTSQLLILASLMSLVYVANSVYCGGIYCKSCHLTDPTLCATCYSGYYYLIDYGTSGSYCISSCSGGCINKKNTVFGSSGTCSYLCNSNSSSNSSSNSTSSSVINSAVKLGTTLMIVVIVVPIVVFLIIVTCILCCIVQRRKRRILSSYTKSAVTLPSIYNQQVISYSPATFQSPTLYQDPYQQQQVIQQPVYGQPVYEQPAYGQPIYRQQQQQMIYY